MQECSDWLPFPLLPTLLVDGDDGFEEEAEERRRDVPVLGVVGGDVQSPDGHETVNREENSNEDGAR